MIGLGLFGFQTAYGGTRYLVAGLVGTLLGFVVALWGARTRQPLLVVSAATVGVFFLFGGAVAVPDAAIAGIVPSPAAVVALVDGAISGWARLLTTTPPAGARDNLLAVPYLCGVVASVIALTIARRTRRGQFAVLPALAVLALSILFGTDEPASLVLQGAAFAVIAIGWVSLHRRMQRRVDVGTGRSSRRLGVLAVLAVAGLAAAVFGGSIPGVGSHPRFVLRDQTEPPFDPRTHPSPLSSYRRYTNEEQLKNSTLFTVKGMEGGEKLRLAVLDSYDGVVYSVGSGSGSSGYFERVGETVSNDVDGSDRDVTLTVEDYTDIWVPGAGYLDAVDFDGPRADLLREQFRYNSSTGSGASGVRLRKGDVFRTRSVLPPTQAGDGARAQVRQPDAVRLEAVEAAGSEFASAPESADPSQPQASDYQRLNGVVDQVNATGATSDGEAINGFESRPGHHARRLVGMVEEGGVMIGNDEQYAPLVALMSRGLGVPARVVMGFVVPPGAPADQPVEIKGSDVAAWVEVAIDGVGWVSLKDIHPQADPTPKPETKSAQQSTDPPPPPPTVPPTEDDEVDVNKVKQDDRKDDSDGFSIPRWVYYAGAITLLPIAVLAAVTGVIAGLKARRRARRRTQGPPSTRVAGGWNEVIDLAADMGTPVPVLATRSEGARLMGTDAAVGLAHHADVGIFGPTDLSEAWVEAYWNDVDGTRVAMTADMSRMERWRVLVSLASLRSSFERWRLLRRLRRTGIVAGQTSADEIAGPGDSRPLVGTAVGRVGSTVGDDQPTQAGNSPGSDSWWRDEGT